MGVHIDDLEGPGLAEIESALVDELDSLWPGPAGAVLPPDGSALADVAELARHGLPPDESDEFHSVYGDFEPLTDPWLDAQNGTYHAIGWFVSWRMLLRAEDGAVLCYIPATDFWAAPRPVPELRTVNSNVAALVECAWRRRASARPLIEHGRWTTELTAAYEWTVLGHREGPPGRDVTDVYARVCEAIIQGLDRYDPGVVAAEGSMWRELLAPDEL